MGSDRAWGDMAYGTCGELLRRYRALAGLTQEELAARSGYSPDYISKIERDQRRPPFVAIDRLAEVLGLEAGDRQTLRNARDRRAAQGREVHLPPLTPRPLPAPPTPLIGRWAERNAVRSALEASRLVTLTGVGGTGKTRLAVQVAAEATANAHFGDGVAFVDLAPLQDPRLLALAIVQALGLPDRSSTPETQLAAALYGRHLLLVVDNVEHLIEAAPLLSRLLAAAPNLSILATSRVPLHLYGEHEIRVSPLPLPEIEAETGGTPAPADPLACDAVQLFIARAKGVVPGFAPVGETLHAVARICIALDGLPLAIELAAARVGLFPPEALLPRLGERLALLTGGPRDLPARQRTLKAALDWSFALLPPSDGVLFTRLGVFAGSFDARAAAAVCAGEDQPAHSAADTGEDAMLTRLGSLAEQSLVEVAPGRTPRFRLLQTVREYALARLADDGAVPGTQTRYLQYYVMLAEEMHAHLRGAEQSAALTRLEEEHDNLRAALRWGLTSGEGMPALRLARSLARFWRYHGHLREGQYWLEAALAQVSGLTDMTMQELQADALNGAGTLAMQRGDYAQAKTFHAQALALRRTLNDAPGIAQSLTALGNVSSRQGDYARSAALHAEALEIWREQNYTRGLSIALGNLGRVSLQQGDDARAQDLLEEALALKRQIGDALGIAGALTSLGRVAAWRGNYAEATALLEESLALKTALGDRSGQVTAFAQLGWAAHLQGDGSRAHAAFGEALRLAGEIGARDRVAEILEGLAVVVAGEGRFHDAAWLGGAAEALRTEMGLPFAPDRQASHEWMTQIVRDRLGEEASRTAWTTGKTQPPEDVIALALAEIVSANGARDTGNGSRAGE